MSARLELDDLPPRYRAQAEKQLAQRRCGGKAAPASLEAAVNAARSTGHEFDSRGEYDYYMGTVLPKVQSGEVVKVELHRRFTMLPEKEYGNVKLPAAHYTPDFVLTYADGTVEVVEVKSKFTRRQQRDYIHRRRMLSILWQNRSTGGLLSISRQIRRKKSESGSAWPNRRERIHHGKKQGKDASILPAEHPECSESANQHRQVEAPHDAEP